MFIWTTKMSLKNSLMKWAITLGLITLPQTQNVQQSIEQKLFTDGEAHLEQIVEEKKDQLLEILFSKNIQNTDSTTFSYKELLQNLPNTQKEIVIKRPLVELFELDPISKRQNPLTIGVRRNLGEILWYNQVDSIVSKYSQTRDSLTATSRYEKSDTLSFPLIYPELKESFSCNLDKELHEDGFSFIDSLDSTSNYCILIKTIGWWKQALAIYNTNREGNQLFLATHVSVGRRKSTPRGEYSTNVYIKHGYSNKYKAPMPYAITFKGGAYLLHQGKVNGTPLSHGCIRVPGLYQEIIYHLVEKGTPILIDEELYKYE